MGLLSNDFSPGWPHPPFVFVLALVLEFFAAPSHKPWLKSERGPNSEGRKKTEARNQKVEDANEDEDDCPHGANLNPAWPVLPASAISNGGNRR